MPIHYAPPPPSAIVHTICAKEESESQAPALLSYATAGPFRYKVLLEDFWDWGDDDDDDDDGDDLE